MKQPTISFILYTSKQLSGGGHPIMMRVTVQGKRRYKSLGFSAMSDQWDEAKSEPKRSHPKRKAVVMTMRLWREQVEQAAEALSLQQGRFTVHQVFAKAGSNERNISVQEFLNQEIDAMAKAGKNGNAAVYRTLRNVINRYQGGKIQDRKRQPGRPLSFYEIDYRWLVSFERDLRERDLTDSAIHNYMRTLRALFNAAVKHNLVKRENYPFNDYRISEHVKPKPKRHPITRDELMRILDLETVSGSYEHFAQLFMKWSYYSRGMNFVDVCLLRWSDIKSDRFTYSRKKTHRLTTIHLTDPLQEILRILEPVTRLSERSFVFPFLVKGVHVTDDQIRHRKLRELKKINTALRYLATAAGIDKYVSTYTARHTFSRVIDQSGVSRDIIQELLGHESLNTTRVYLDSLSDDRLQDALKNL